MRLPIGSTIEIGGIPLRVMRLLGSGAVATVYEVDLAGYRLVLKVLGDEWESDGEQAKGLEREGKVLEVLNKAEDPEYPSEPDIRARINRLQVTATERVIIACLSYGKVYGRPFVLQEMAPPEIHPSPVKSVDDELRILQVMERVAKGMKVAHEQGYALLDFKSPEKADRIRVQWLEGHNTPLVRIIDWNITGGAEDFPQDLFYFGAHLYHFLTGWTVPLDEEGYPPRNLGMDVPTWSILTEGTKYILRRLLHRNPEKRYVSASSLYDDLKWWVETVLLTRTEHWVTRMRERTFNAMGLERYDRVLAVADLTLRFPLSEKDKQEFETFYRTAQEELEKELRVVLARLNIDLQTNLFSLVVSKADQELTHLDPKSEITRHIRYLRLLALVGEDLQKKRKIYDPRGLKEWNDVKKAVDRLIERRWDEAEQLLTSALQSDPRLKDIEAFRRLQELAKAGVRFNEVVGLHEDARPRGRDIRLETWADIEQEKIRLLENAVDMLDGLVKIMGQMEDFPAETYALYSRELRTRQENLRLLKRSKEALAARRYITAREELEKVLQNDPSNPYARELIGEVRRYEESVLKVEESKGLLEEGEYAQAFRLLQDALEASPPADKIQEIKDLLAIARAGKAVQTYIAQKVDDALRLLRERENITPDDIANVGKDIKAIERLDGISWDQIPWNDVRAHVPDSLVLSDILHHTFPKFVVSDSLQQRIGEIKSILTRRADELVAEEIRRLTDYWDSARFEERRRIDRRIDEWVSESVKASLDDVEKNLRDSSRIIQEFEAAVSNLRRDLETKGPDKRIVEELEHTLRHLTEEVTLPSSVTSEAQSMLYGVEGFLINKDPAAILSICEEDYRILNKAAILLCQFGERYIRQEVEISRRNSDYKRMRELLEILSRIRTLTEEEIHWKEEAEDFLSREEESRSILQRVDVQLRNGNIDPTVFENLRIVLEKLENNASKNANEIRSEVATYWQRAARLLSARGERWVEIQDRIKEGIEHLQRFELHDDLETDLSLLEKVIRVEQILSMGSETINISNILEFNKLVRDIDSALEKDKWEMLLVWREEQKRIFRNRVKALSRNLKDDLQAGRYNEAWERYQKISNWLENPWGDALRDNVNSILNIKEVNRILNTQREIESIWDKIRARKPDYREIEDRIKNLPKDISDAGLKKEIEGLNLWLEIKSFLSLEPILEKYALTVDQCVDKQIRLSNYIGSNVYKEKKNDILHELEDRLEERCRRLVRDISNRFEEEKGIFMESLRTGKPLNLKNLISLCWQTRWLIKKTSPARSGEEGYWALQAELLQNLKERVNEGVLNEQWLLPKNIVDIMIEWTKACMARPSDLKLPQYPYVRGIDSGDAQIKILREIRHSIDRIIDLHEQRSAEYPQHVLDLYSQMEIFEKFLNSRIGKSRAR